MTIGVLRLALALTLLAQPLLAADLVYEVHNPFRFYKSHRSFEMHQAAFAALGKEAAPSSLPDDAGMVERIDRRLNTVACTNDATYSDCFRTSGLSRQAFRQRRLGWASRSHADTCYDSVGSQSGGQGPRRFGYPARCMRSELAGTALVPHGGPYAETPASDDYIRPGWHSVIVSLPQALRAAHAGKICRWQGRRIADNSEVVLPDGPCERALAIARVPWDPDVTKSGLSVTVTLPDSTSLTTPVQVKDLLVVGLGDSFASGEGNPDVPVQLHQSSALTYGGQPPVVPMRETAYPQVTPDQLHESAAQDRLVAARAGWISRDCHRSQYSYQVRAALQLALEDRTRAVTLVHLACTGAEATLGLFGDKPAREVDEGFDTRVRPQFAQLFDLLCARPARGRLSAKSYVLPVPVHAGEPAMMAKAYRLAHCAALKRPIDVVLLSLGGNDIGFSAVVGNAIMDTSKAVAPIVYFMEKITRERAVFGADIAAAYLRRLPERLLRVRDALRDGFQTAPDTVIQTNYELFHRGNDGALCAGTTGLDVHGEFAFRPKAMREADTFARGFMQRIACSADPADPACTRAEKRRGGTGFVAISAHRDRLERHGLCAVDPHEKANLAMVKIATGQSGFSNYAPFDYLPYQPRRRMFVTANDAFLTANSHLDRIKCKLFQFDCPHFNDLAQRGFSALYSGSFHRSALGHAVVADAVMAALRKRYPARTE